MTDNEKKALVKILHELILRAVPRAETKPKYGGVLYTLKPNEKEGQFCGVFTYKAHVQLAFSQGASLEDPEGVLEGNGKYRRHITIESIDEIPEKQLLRLLKFAARD